MGHSIYMSSIKIDTKSWYAYSTSFQLRQNVLLCKPYETEFSIMYA